MVTDPAATTALSQAQAPQESTTLSSTFHYFTALHYDIRFLIYKELMVQRLDLYPLFCPSCAIGSNAVSTCTQMLRTSKQIYSELLPLFYSMNTVHVKCRKCEQSANFKLWDCRVKLHDESLGHLESYYRYVKHVAIAYETKEYHGHVLASGIASGRPYRLTFYNRGDIYSHHSQASEFSTKWPRIEREILRLYGNTEHISLQIRSGRCFDMTLDLVRKPKTERPYDYEGVLAQDNIMEYYGTDYRSVYEETCRNVLQSRSHGELKDTTFAVDRIRWKGKRGEGGEFVLFLRCDKQSTGDTSIEQIFSEHNQRMDGKRPPLDAGR